MAVTSCEDCVCVALSPLDQVSVKICAAELYLLQESKNEGRGVECVRQVCSYLALGYRREAVTAIQKDWDEIANYPDICAWLKKRKLAKMKNHVNQ